MSKFQNTLYHWFFPEKDNLPYPKLRWTILILIQELSMCKFKAVFKYFVKESYRNDINKLRNILSKGKLYSTKTQIQLKNIHFSHEINYPEWVEYLQKQILKTGEVKSMKVFHHEGKVIVIDGNHRLKAMKQVLSHETWIDVRLLRYRDTLSN